MFARMENFVNASLSKRLSREDALGLLRSASPLAAGELADAARRKMHGGRAFYSVNAAITYSNICEAMCPICSFARREGEEGGYLLTPEEVYRRASDFSKAGALEIHIIGGIYSKLPLEYYLDVVRAVKSADKNLNVVAYTVSECDLISRVSQKPLEEVIGLLMEAGVNALPGGGAEIFEESIRKKISPNKLTADQWLDAMRTTHRAGLKTNATMLYGHIESDEHVVDHLLRLRDLQDETGGFKAFVPLPYRQGKSSIQSKASGAYDLKICALARLILDNFPHIRVPITHFGDRLAQILLNFGADDVGGTHWNEEVAVSAGAAQTERDAAFMRRTIAGAGFEAVEGNSNYGA